MLCEGDCSVLETHGEWHAESALNVTCSQGNLLRTQEILSSDDDCTIIACYPEAWEQLVLVHVAQSQNHDCLPCCLINRLTL
jgi:hypothetical protein